jgi:hypothetical protein
MNSPYVLRENIVDGCPPLAEWFNGWAAVTVAQAPHEQEMNLLH